MLRNYGKLLLRTPLQSLEAVNAIGVDEPTAFRDGIYLSSWDLYNELNREGGLPEKDKSRINFAYSKYWIRSCTRCTPYATFAGFSLVKIAKQPTELVLDSNSLHTLKLRVDVDFIAGLAQSLSIQPQIRKQITFYTNNSLYESPTGYRYAEYRLDNGKRKYELTSLQKSPYLTDILALATGGATINALQQILISYEGVNLEEADDFISELIESQLLISDLEPTVTGAEPFDQLIEKLSGLSGCDETLAILLRIQLLFNSNIKDESLFKEINALFGQLIEKPLQSSIVQADLLPKLRNDVIDDELVAELTDQLQDLFLLSRPADHPELEKFKNTFITKYEDAEMPLTHVLDAEYGIGYGDFGDESSANNVLIGDLAFQNGQASSRTEFDDIQQLAFNKYLEYVKSQKAEILIDKGDLTIMKKKTESFKFSKSIYALGSLMKLAGKLDKEHFLFDVSAFGGTSSANLYGKFTHASDELAKLSSEILKKEEEQNMEAIYAEIVHLPEAQVGNILLRPVLRPYEIPYVGRSGVDHSHQISLNDLYVSIRQGEVILTSKRLGKRIIPKSTTAHNYNYKGLPVYKFLCSLQSQLNAKINVWDWGNLDSLRYLPRVVYKNLVLKKATWKFTSNDIADIPLNKEDIGPYFSNFRIKWGLPLRVSYLEEDNKLLIDFSQDYGIQIFVHYLKKLKRIFVEEYLLTPENCVVKDREGKAFTNEIILPLYEEMMADPPLIPKARPKNERIKKKFLPGSEWSYFKVYAGLKVSEEFLKIKLLSFVENGIASNLFEKFFMIRFKDDFTHLRIRFYNTNTHRQYELIQAFLRICEPLLENEYIHRVCMETYIRETNRYGEDLIEESEELFYNDSLAVLRLLRLIDGQQSDIYRMLFTIRGIDFLLDDFQLSVAEKEEFARYLQAIFFKEFGGGDQLQHQLNNKYRNYQQLIFSHMDGNNDEENDIVDAVQLLKIRSLMNAPVIKRILKVIETEPGGQRLNELVSSYIHMFANRMFLGKQRMNELVIYHFLERYYRSKSAIFKRSQKQGTNLIISSVQ